MPALFTNVLVYRAIAEEAAAEMHRLIDLGRRPKLDGQPGYVVTVDPDQKSFKQGMIAIAFAGMYLEALLGLSAHGRLPRRERQKFRSAAWEGKLKLLGVRDPGILESTTKFRRARNHLVHEKVVDLDSLGAEELLTAQEEAERAIELIGRISSILAATASR